MKRTVLITGGARGIGAAVAKSFAAEGWRTAIAYRRSRAAAEELSSLLTMSGCESAAFCCDVSDAEQAAALVKGVIKRFGDIDALVNNAGVAAFGFFADGDAAQDAQVIETDLMGAMNCARAVLPGMLRRRTGRIVNISSIWGQTGGSCEAAYSAAKAGLIGFTKALAKETACYGVRVNCVAPGFIDTEMNARFRAEERAQIIGDIPCGRAGTPSEVAALVRFLCGASADFITGQVIAINGGAYM